MSSDIPALRVLRRTLLIGALALGVALSGSTLAYAAAVGGGGGEEGGTGFGPGAFVIGDGNAVVESRVTFWGARWWKENSLSGGAAPASFKGFADAGETLCGSPWSARPGNSSEPPPAPLPEFIEVIIASEIGKSGPTVGGNGVGVALVRTEPGYQPDPGHAGTGTVVAILC